MKDYRITGAPGAWVIEVEFTELVAPGMTANWYEEISSDDPCRTAEEAGRRLDAVVAMDQAQERMEGSTP